MSLLGLAQKKNHSLCDASETSGFIRYPGEPLIHEKKQTKKHKNSVPGIMLDTEGNWNCKIFSAFEELAKFLSHYSK